MDDPDVILRVHRYADGLSHDPVIRQRLGPQRIHLESRRLHRGSFHHRPLFEDSGSHPEPGNYCQKRYANAKVTLRILHKM